MRRFLAYTIKYINSYKIAIKTRLAPGNICMIRTNLSFSNNEIVSSLFYGSDVTRNYKWNKIIMNHFFI